MRMSMLLGGLVCSMVTGTAHADYQYVEFPKTSAARPALMSTCLIENQGTESALVWVEIVERGNDGTVQPEQVFTLQPSQRIPFSTFDRRAGRCRAAYAYPARIHVEPLVQLAPDPNEIRSKIERLRQEARRRKAAQLEQQNHADSAILP